MTTHPGPAADGFEATSPLVERMTRWLSASQAETFPYEIDLLGHRFTVLEGVFSPRYYSETEFYAEQLVRRLRPEQTLLDLGCGIGVNAVLGALRGARVTALDLNEAAVGNTRLNAERHRVSDRVTVATSDVFSGLAPNSRFDAIYWNVPFTYRPAHVQLTVLEEAIFDRGYRKNREFVGTAARYLTPGGEILMGVSETLGDMGAILRMARDASLQVERLASVHERGTPEMTRLQLLRLTP